MSSRESYPESMTCLLQGPLAVGDAVAAARGFAETCELASQDIARLCIVVEELIANLYDHGGLTDADQVELRLAAEPDGIRISIADHGTPFDPRTVPPNPERPDRGGGAGIELVRAWARILSYEVTSEGNRIELLLPPATTSR
jgi:serine/threonine-protein kinase RsbW